MKSLVSIFLLLGLTANAIGAETQSANVERSEQQGAQPKVAVVVMTSKIKSIHALWNGEFIIELSFASPQCTNEPKYHYVTVGQMGVTAEGASRMFSAAQAAAEHGRVVDIHFDADSPNCYVSRLRTRY